MNIIKALNDQFGRELINGLSLNLGAGNDEVQKSINGALPALMGGLINKVHTKAGASELFNLLNKKNYKGDLLNDVGNLFSGSASINLLKQGLDVLPMMLGGQSKMGTILNIAGGLFGGGLSRSQSVFGMLAPVLLSFIGKKMRSEQLDQKGLVSLLTGQKEKILQSLHGDIAKEMGFANNTQTDELEATTETTETDETAYEESTDETSEGRRFPKWLIPFGFIFGAIAALFLLTKACGEIPEEKQKAMNAKKTQQQENRAKQQNQKNQSNKPLTNTKPNQNNTAIPKTNINNNKPTNTQANRPNAQNQVNTNNRPNTATQPKTNNTNNNNRPNANQPNNKPNQTPTPPQATGGRQGIQNQTTPQKPAQQTPAKPIPNNNAQNNNPPPTNTNNQAPTPATRPNAQPAKSTTNNSNPSTKKYRGSVGVVDQVARKKETKVINFGTVTTDNLTLTRSAESNFKKIAQIMNDNPATKISIRAHNQDYKNPAQNATAKKNGITRAKLLQQLMVSQGVQANRIKVESLGNTDFLIPQDTGNARNQRISIKIN